MEKTTTIDEVCAGEGYKSLLSPGESEVEPFVEVCCCLFDVLRCLLLFVVCCFFMFI